MVALTAENHGWWHFLLRRGTWVMGVGVFVDLVVWQIFPAMSLEVLYLIGVSIPLVYLATRLPAWAHWGATAVFLLSPPLLQGWLGYAPFPIEFYLSGYRVFPPEGQTSILTHWLVDGWFPVFPWVGFSLLGAGLGRAWRQHGVELLRPWLGWGGLGLTLAGVGAYLLYPPQTFIRGSWSEMFYPPTLQYEMASTGISCLLFLLFVSVKGNTALLRLPMGVLATLGRASLGLYFGHLFLGYHVLTRIAGGWGMMTWAQYAASYAAILVALWAVSWGYGALGQRWGRRAGQALRVLVAGTIAVFIVLVVAGRYPLPGGFPILPGQ